MEDLKEIFLEICKYSKDITHDKAIEVSAKIFISQNIQRDKFKSPMPQKTVTELATDKQIYFFRKNNLAIPNGLTKQKASEIINSFKETNK